MKGDNIHLFWTKPAQKDTTLANWRQRPITLNPSHILSLQSHAKFGHNVNLYTYQTIANELPNNVTVIDADQYFPELDAWASLGRGHSIAHISDLVRLRAANKHGGLVIDMDSIIVNELPDVDGFFCTIPAKVTGGVAPKWGKANPPFVVHDGTWDGKALSNFPVKINKDMKTPIDQLAQRIEQTLKVLPSTSTKAWNYVMWALKDISRTLPNAPVFPPIKAGPVPAWLGPGQCYSIESPTRLTGTQYAFGYRLPSIQEIFDQSYIVQHFFESAFQSRDQQQTPATFWYDMPPNSLIGLLAKQTVGPKWKTLLPKLGQTKTNFDNPYTQTNE